MYYTVHVYTYLCTSMQVLSTQQLEQMKLDWLEKVEQHMRKVCPCKHGKHRLSHALYYVIQNTEDGQNELETVRGYEQ